MKQKCRIQFIKGTDILQSPVTATLYVPSFGSQTLTQTESKANNEYLKQFSILKIKGKRYKIIDSSQQQVVDQLDPFSGKMTEITLKYEEMPAVKVQWNQPITKLELVTAILVSTSPRSRDISDETIFKDNLARAKSLLEFITESEL